LATQQFQALSSMNQNLLNTTSGVNETNHSRGQSIDLGQVNVATSFARNSDFDRGLSESGLYSMAMADLTSIKTQNSVNSSPFQTSEKNFSEF
jgi:hypothetical protein